MRLILLPGVVPEPPNEAQASADDGLAAGPALRRPGAGGPPAAGGCRLGRLRAVRTGAAPAPAPAPPPAAGRAAPPGRSLLRPAGRRQEPLLTIPGAAAPAAAQSGRLWVPAAAPAPAAAAAAAAAGGDVPRLAVAAGGLLGSDHQLARAEHLLQTVQIGLTPSRGPLGQPDRTNLAAAVCDMR